MEMDPLKADLVYVVINRYKNDYYAPIKKALDNLNVISQFCKTRTFFNNKGAHSKAKNIIK